MFPLFETLKTQFNGRLIGTKDFFQAPLSHPLPIRHSGSCKAGTEWTITNTSDLYEAELDCLWEAGVVPSRVPLGFNHGSLLQFGNSTILTAMTPFFYQGDFAFTTRCGSEDMTIGMLYFGGQPMSTGVWSINSFPWESAPGEFYSGKKGVLMDFSVDVAERCASSIPRYPLLGFSMFKTYGWPMRLFIDLLTWVGCDEDGGHLLLGRTWMLDPRGDNDKREGHTILFFVLKSFDQNAIPVGKSCGDSVTLDIEFEYNRSNFLKGLLPRFNPFSWIVAGHKGRQTNGVLDYGDSEYDSFVPLLQGLASRYFPGFQSFLPLLNYF